MKLFPFLSFSFSLYIGFSLPFLSQGYVGKISHLCTFKTPFSGAVMNGEGMHNGLKNRRQTLKMSDPNINVITKYKSFFDRENINEIMEKINTHQLSDIYINKNYPEIVAVDAKVDVPTDVLNYHLSTDVNPLLLQEIVNKAFENKVLIHFADFNDINGFFAFISKIPDFIIPFFIGTFILNFIRNIILSLTRGGGPGMNQFGGGGGGNPFPFNSQFEVQSIKPNVTLDQWAGSPEVKEECEEVINYVYNKELYQSAGAEMPKGILLEGPPGTGKTMIAKAIATETNSNFIAVSSSAFVEVFVGVGAQKVRNLFEEARRNKPCVIFIDEIDAVGKQRGGSGFRTNGNDEQEQTLNQLLFEMDGFNDNEDILVLAATNRKEVLDAALLRPGRFDRIIKVPLPDKYSREKILENYLKRKRVDPSVNVTFLAELTNGYSGADIKNLVNEAAILTVKQNSAVLTEESLLSALEKSMIGLVKKNYTAPYETRARVAYHETGHALLVYLYPQYFDLQKVSIQSTYNGAGGYTMFMEKPEIQENGLYTKDILKKRLIITLGGKAAESIMYGDNFVSLGAREDLKQANGLANQMIGTFGMGDQLEVFSVNEEKQLRNIYSETFKTEIDAESLDLVREAYEEAKTLLKKHKEKLIAFSHILMNKTNLYQKDMEKVFSVQGNDTMIRDL